MLIRSDWKNASHFHDLTNVEVLREVSRRVATARSQNRKSVARKPIVLLDLDSTLYEVGPRTHFILNEWRHSVAGGSFPRVCSELERLEQEHVGYSLKDTFAALGLPAEDPEVADALREAKDFWLKRFFTSEYLKHDRAYPGAASFVREVHELGALIVYLTGRDEPGMGEGTITNLIRDQFPWNTENTHLLLKPAFGLSDIEHKKNAAHYIRRHGELVASFENEPANLVAIYELFPEAMHVFVETVSSDHAAPSARGLYRIHGFETAAQTE
jgi:hypothetical protein